MRLSRTNIILIAVLVVQVAVGVLVFRPTNALQTTGGSLIANFNPGAVTQITIRDKDKNEIVLAKGSDGTWVLPKADNFPASPSAVSGFLDKLKALQTDRLIAQNPASQSQLHVTDSTYERLIDIQSGDHVDHLYVGSSGGANATHMRLNDQNQVYLTSGLAALDAAATPATWITTMFYSAQQDQFTHLTLQNAQGSFDFQKINGQWTMAGLGATEHFNQAGLDRVLGQLTGIVITAPFGKAPQDKFKMQQPMATITVTISQPVTVTATPTPVGMLPLKATPTPGTITTSKETTTTLVIGAKLDDGDYVLKSSDSPYYVEIIASTAELFTNLKRDDVLTPPPTAAATIGTPSPTATPPDF